MNYRKLILPFSIIAIISCSIKQNPNNQLARNECTGSSNCNACKTCKYCKHCAKNGGACGVCK